MHCCRRCSKRGTTAKPLRPSSRAPGACCIARSDASRDDAGFGLKDRRNGYPTYRAWNEFVPLLLGARLDANRPDLVVADFSSENPILPEALARKIPTLLRISMMWPAERQVGIPHDPFLQAYSNSAFMASRSAPSTESKHQSSTLRSTRSGSGLHGGIRGL